MTRSQSLDALGRAHATDKASHGHGYLSFYERFFEPLRGRDITLLEIGVLNGASLKVWEAYFPRARIIGADIEPGSAGLARERVTIEIIDQSNLEDLVRLGMRHGPFDIVIEDGSHLWEHQVTTLRTLFPFVRDGGYYVVEDLNTNYGELAGKYRGVASRSCVDYLKELADLHVADDSVDLAKVEDPFLRTYARNLGLISFHKHCCLLQKSYTSWRLVSDEPLLGAGESTKCLALMAHLGRTGDCKSETGSLRGLADGQGIQGFSIGSGTVAAGSFEYRARLSDGNWTAWSRPGTYVGTRYEAHDLTGFSFRLTGDLQRESKVVVAGLFGHHAEPVIAGDGEECVSGRLALRGMQVSIRPR
ncbi:MAG: class I SAM-dependent methyltransferase [Burkholderiales bacterium]|nr:class I SAM-dependent methyltransferase [Burkholderiales bacterium]